MVLGERLAQELKELYTKVNNEGKLLSKAQLEGYYETFRKRFGPDQLKSVDGEALLILMHDHGNHDSLVYWLEFKNDIALEQFISSPESHELGRARRAFARWVAFGKMSV